MLQGEAPITSVVVRQLTVTDFRNHASARMETDALLVVLAGPNGAGKTNLLEALSMLAPGRGLRGAQLADMIRVASPGERAAGWTVAAQIDGLRGPVRIGIAWRDTEQEGGGRKVLIDGKAVRSSAELGQHVRLGWLTPAMDRLFGGPASDRRRFLDRMTAALDPEHALRTGGLERLLRQRNRLLEDIGRNAAWLDAVEAKIAETAVAVAAARMAALEALEAGMKMVEKHGGAFPFARLRLQGWVEGRLRESPALEVEDACREMLAAGRVADAAAGRTLQGPHRSDLRVEHGPKGMPARLCSTGEQKALLIAIVLAHAAAVKALPGCGAPLLLLDEVAAHLDARRRAGLFDALKGLGCQAWMTGTDAELFSQVREEACFLRVEDGRII